MMNECQVPRLSDEILRGMYGRDLGWFQETYRLTPSSDIELVRTFPDVQSGLAWAALTDLTLALPTDAMVVGGACLSYCEARAERLGLEVVADVLVPLHLAQFIQLPCLIYLGVAEEAMASESAVPLVEWQMVGDTVEAMTRELAKLMGLAPPLIFRTDSQATASAVEEAAHLLQGHLTDARLSGLYTVTSSGRTPASGRRLAQYRRNVVSYLPSVVRCATDTAVSHVIAAENVHQVKAVRLARELAQIARARDAQTTDRIDHLIYLSPPSITGSRRMCQARPESSIYLLSDGGRLAQQLQRMSEASRYYWTHVWPRSLLGAWFHDDSPSLADIVAHVQELARRCVGLN